MPGQRLAAGYFRFRWAACALAILMSALAFGGCAAQKPAPADPHLRAPQVAAPAVAQSPEPPSAQTPPIMARRVDLDPTLQAASATLESALTASGTRVAAWWKPR